MKKSFIVRCPTAVALGVPSGCALALEKVRTPPLVHKELQQRGGVAIVTLAPEGDGDRMKNSIF